MQVGNSELRNEPKNQPRIRPRWWQRTNSMPRIMASAKDGLTVGSHKACWELDTPEERAWQAGDRSDPRETARGEAYLGKRQEQPRDTS